ncbi:MULTISPECIES: TetR/AcrR family transcriptional regulator [Kordiimonas]|jgi:TetR/AcrR family transcriptional repressor of lmrAB and yxaGH operons|uniref:Transcriptional regulator, TetR family n=1 Tax=Kordiimonas lacus TaxID=637679 RepID=A0A1G6YDD3_9PROT|nr:MULTISPECIES: TetR/AcrR family transcriptional regulator [Kordiimonas]SDD88342.1 transcriptional regulator, TetR family [Kordiimonas lacus]
MSETTETAAKAADDKRKKVPQNRSKHEAALIHAAAVLFRKQGYAATGTAEILKRSGAPRGSLYYYFPEGKEAIGAAALEAASKVATRTFRELAGSAESPAGFVQAYASLLAGWMEKSDYTDGCPVATTVLETVPHSDLITPVAKASFNHWQRAVSDMLLSHDWPRARVRATATLILSAFEGALITARVEKSSRPILDTADELSVLLKR